MKQETLKEKLEKEKEKLNKLVSEALNKGAPLTEDEAIIEQNRKVDDLVVKLQREKENLRKKQEER
ncbi:hypothetical protein [Thermotalea metallivorans]|uniref:Uncharacterized protein n=1 Tax=Thermotalea metallivorans TaxID=520762 RepID=A0A140L9A2_9FIRM|nr:hypothetical protein [Thermotalea metallivorans]KXG77127.1 hypothetical protein AN619_06570 [Thermotalea metallivorans]